MLNTNPEPHNGWTDGRGPVTNVVDGVIAGATKRPGRARVMSLATGRFVQGKSGGDLLSQGVTPQVPSALAVFTTVFGMGTGVSPPLWPPEHLSCKNRCQYAP